MNLISGRWSSRIGKIFQALILLVFSALALFPVLLVLVNSFKERVAIFDFPLKFPSLETFSAVGYQTVFNRSNYLLFFTNSLVVTLVSLSLILLFGSMAAWAFSEYEFKGNKSLGFYMALGIMIPIRLGTVSILRLVVSMGLVNTLASLILVYTASGLPMTIFIVQQFMAQIPSGLKDAGRIDGASEYRIFLMLLPLIRPVLGTVAIFTMIPIWNDLWFPLILAPSRKTQTVILGSQQFLGQYLTDWNAVLASLSMAAIPIVLLYMIFSRQLVRSLTAGAIK